MNEELKRFWKYLSTVPSERKSISYCLLRVMIILALLFFIVLPFVLLFGLAFLTFPWVFTIGIFCALGFALISLLWGLIIKKWRYQAWNTSSWVFRILMAFWAWAFIFPTSFGHLTNWTMLKNNTDHLQVPLNMPNGIAVDSKGYVYLSILPFQRIQVYDKNGEFIRGWSASIGKEGGKHRLVIDEQDKLHVLNDYRHAIYDAKGRLLSYSESNQSKTLIVNNPRWTMDSDGNIYEFEDKSESDSFWSLFSKVIKTTPDGHQSIFITDPLPLWLIKMILPTFGLLALSGITAGILGWLASKAKKAQQPTTKTEIGLGFFLAVLLAKITKRKVDLNKYFPASNEITNVLSETSEQFSKDTQHEESDPIFVLRSVFCPSVTSSTTIFLQLFLTVWGVGFVGGCSYIALKELGISIPPKLYFIVFGCIWFLVIMKLSYLMKKSCHDITEYCFYANRLEYDDVMSIDGRRKVPYSEIKNVEFRQIWGQKKRGLGTIYLILNQSEENDNEIELFNIPEAEKALDKIKSLIASA